LPGHYGRFAGNPAEPQNFSARAGSFRFSAELLNLQRVIQEFGCSFDFPADDFVFRRRSGLSAEHCDFPAEVFLFPRNFFFFRRRIRRSLENLNFRAEIQIFAGDVRAPAEDLNFSAEVSDFQRQI